MTEEYDVEKVWIGWMLKEKPKNKNKSLNLSSNIFYKSTQSSAFQIWICKCNCWKITLTLIGYPPEK